MNKENRELRLEELNDSLELIDAELDAVYNKCVAEIKAYGKEKACDLLSNIYLDAISVVELNEYIFSEGSKRNKLDDKRNGLAVKMNTTVTDMDHNVLPGVLAMDAYAFAAIGLSSGTFNEFLGKTVIMLTGTIGMYLCASRAHVSKGNKYRLREKDLELKKEIELYDKSLELLVKCKEFYNKIIAVECIKYLELENRFTKGWKPSDLIRHIYSDLHSGEYKQHVSPATQMVEKEIVKARSKGYRC